MHTKTLRIVLALGLIVVCLSVGFFIGYNRGYNTASKLDTEFSIVAFSNLFKLADAGDTVTLRGKLQTLVYMYVMDYEKRFGQHANTDPAFLKHLSEANAIADGVVDGVLGKPKKEQTAK